VLQKQWQLLLVSRGLRYLLEILLLPLPDILMGELQLLQVMLVGECAHSADSIHSVLLFELFCLFHNL